MMCSNNERIFIMKVPYKHQILCLAAKDGNAHMGAAGAKCIDGSL
jgi:hypothetical protein